MKKRELSPELLAQIAALDALGEDDSDIDTTDIPEISDAQWARRVRPGQMADTLHVEAETVRWFRETSHGRDYRAEMNTILRRAMLRRRRRAQRAAING